MATDSIPVAAPFDLGLFPPKRLVIEPLTGDPVGGDLRQGRVWLNTTDGAFRGVRAAGVVDTFQIVGGAAGLTQEQVEDIVAAMHAAPQSGLTITYTDNGAGIGTLAFAVSGVTSAMIADGTILNADIDPNAAINLDKTADSAAGAGRLAMVNTERTKLGGVAAGATANSTDAFLLNRANHSGQQGSSTISDFAGAVDARAQTISDATKASILGTASAAYDTLQEIQALMQADDTQTTGILNSLGTKVNIISPATIVGNTLFADVVHNRTTRDCGLTARFDDGDFEDVNVIVERPTTAKMTVRFNTARAVRVLPWSLA